MSSRDGSVDEDGATVEAPEAAIGEEPESAVSVVEEDEPASSFEEVTAALDAFVVEVATASTPAAVASGLSAPPANLVSNKDSVMAT